MLTDRFQAQSPFPRGSSAGLPGDVPSADLSLGSRGAASGRQWGCRPCRDRRALARGLRPDSSTSVCVINQDPLRRPDICEALRPSLTLVLECAP